MSFVTSRFSIRLTPVIVERRRGMGNIFLEEMCVKSQADIHCIRFQGRQTDGLLNKYVDRHVNRHLNRQADRQPIYFLRIYKNKLSGLCPFAHAP